MKNLEFSDDPEDFYPWVKDVGVRADTIVSMLVDGANGEEILNKFPGLTNEDIIDSMFWTQENVPCGVIKPC